MYFFYLMWTNLPYINVMHACYLNHVNIWNWTIFTLFMNNLHFIHWIACFALLQCKCNVGHQSGRTRIMTILGLYQGLNFKLISFVDFFTFHDFFAFHEREMANKIYKAFVYLWLYTAVQYWQILTGVNFINFFAPYALGLNFCASKKLLKKLGVGAECKWMELPLWFCLWVQLL